MEFKDKLFWEEWDYHINTVDEICKEMKSNAGN